MINNVVLCDITIAWKTPWRRNYKQYKANLPASYPLIYIIKENPRVFSSLVPVHYDRREGITRVGEKAEDKGNEKITKDDAV